MNNAGYRIGGALSRVELHVHTNYSTMDAPLRPDRLVRRAAQMGVPALAVTDHGNVLAFPELEKAGQE